MKPSRPKPNFPPKLRTKGVRITNSTPLDVPKGQGRDGNWLPLPAGYEDDEENKKKRKRT